MSCLAQNAIPRSNGQHLGIIFRQRFGLTDNSSHILAMLLIYRDKFGYRLARLFKTDR
jgi:hypothetical protein